MDAKSLVFLLFALAPRLGFAATGSVPPSSIRPGAQTNLAPSNLRPSTPISADQDPCAALAPQKPGLGRYPVKKPEDGYRYEQDCQLDQYWVRVETSPEMKRLLKGLSTTLGQVLPVYSCYRSQETQDEILCRNKCAPRFGTKVCEGRSAANLSQHTVGAAADIYFKTDLPLNSAARERRQESLRLCRVLNQNRRASNGGWGGITVYGVSAKGVAYLHMDPVRDWCNWGDCTEVPELGEGNCKRTKFRETEARLMQQLADAQKAKARADVQRLEAALKKLRADCPPGDISCRDLFKTL